MSKDKHPDSSQDHPLLDFPDGNGDPNCPICKGRGVTPVMMDTGGGGVWPGGVSNCKCMFKHDLEANVLRVWKVLGNVISVDQSPLLDLTNQNLWITASNYDLRRHLRFVAYRMGVGWDARVIADATLVTAWLSTVKDVHDADVVLERKGFNRDRPSDHFFTLVDLAVPFDLLIIRLGVKAAKNREMPNVLAEAVNERELQGKPTWIVDSPTNPLAPGHICYNDSVLEMLDGFRRVILSDSPHTPDGVTPAAQQYKAPRRASGASSALSQGGASPYTRRKGTMAPVASQPIGNMPMDDLEDDMDRVVPGPGKDDEDDVSIDALLAGAHTPNLIEPGGGLITEPNQIDVDELVEDFPTADELGGNAKSLPSFLRGTLTKEDRITKDRKEKWNKRNKKRGNW